MAPEKFCYSYTFPPSGSLQGCRSERVQNFDLHHGDIWRWPAMQQSGQLLCPDWLQRLLLLRPHPQHRAAGAALRGGAHRTGPWLYVLPGKHTRDKVFVEMRLKQYRYVVIGCPKLLFWKLYCSVTHCSNRKSLVFRCFSLSFPFWGRWHGTMAVWHLSLMPTGNIAVSRKSQRLASFVAFGCCLLISTCYSWLITWSLWWP